MEATAGPFFHGSGHFLRRLRRDIRQGLLERASGIATGPGRQKNRVAKQVDQLKMITRILSIDLSTLLVVLLLRECKDLCYGWYVSIPEYPLLFID